MIQRVQKASVEIAGGLRSEINSGLLVFVGVSNSDTHADTEYIVDKIIHLRIFPDSDGRFHFSVKDIKGELMVISQFTLHADTRRGRRPSFVGSMEPGSAEKLFNEVVSLFKDCSGLRVAEGEFGCHMEIGLINDGPVTIWLDSENRALPKRGSV